MAIALTFSERNEPAGAHAPHPGLNFAIGVDVDGDGTNDCGSGVPEAVGDGAPDAVPVEVTNTTCAAGAGAELSVRGYLTNTGGVGYEAASIHVEYAGVTPDGHGESVWEGCVYAVVAGGAGFENSGCTVGPASGGPRTHLGVLSIFAFTCSASGTIGLGAEFGETGITDNFFEEHREGGVDVLTVQCGSQPTVTPTAQSTPGVTSTAIATTTATAPATPIATTGTPAATPVATGTAVVVVTATAVSPATATAVSTATSTAVQPNAGTDGQSDRYAGGNGDGDEDSRPYADRNEVADGWSHANRRERRVR